MLRNADGGGGIIFSGKKRYEGVRFNVISVMRGWVGGPISRKSVTEVKFESGPISGKCLNAITC